MDIVGALGYAGQPLQCIGPDKLGFSNGSGIIGLNDNGPVDMFPRAELGISSWKSHERVGHLAIAPKANGAAVDLLDLATKEVVCKLPNQSTGYIIDMSFSHDGDRILALSDVADHRVMMWDSATGKCLFSTDAPCCVKSCVLNDGDSSMFALYGDEGVYIGFITEIMGESSVSFEKIELFVAPVKDEEDMDMEMESEADEITAIAMSNSIGFVVWAPHNVIYASTAQGAVLFCNVITKVTKVISWVASYQTGAEGGAGGGGMSYASCALLTASSLVVGSSDGMVLWFPLNRLHAALSQYMKPAAAAAGGDGATAPGTTVATHVAKTGGATDAPAVQVESIEVAAQQIARVGRYDEPSAHIAISTIVLDSSYASLHVGARCGAIYKFQVEIMSTAKEGEIEEESAELPDKAEEAVEITAEPYCNFHEGAVLCSAALCLPVAHMEDGMASKKYSTTLSVFLTGSHLGTVTCWQAPAPAPAAEHHGTSKSASPRHDPKAIRSAVPTLLKVMCRAKVEGGSADLNDLGDPNTVSRLTSSNVSVTPAVTVLETLATASSTGGRLLAVGTSDGYVEVWWVQAFESDDEETAENNGDEEGNLFKVKITKVFRRHLYNTPVSIVKSNVNRHLFAVGSMSSRTMYVINTINVSHFDVVARIHVTSNELQEAAEEGGSAPPSPAKEVSSSSARSTEAAADAAGHRDDNAAISDPAWQPLTCSWKDDAIWVVCRNGCVLMYTNIVDTKTSANSHSTLKFNYNNTPPVPAMVWNTNAGNIGCVVSNTNGSTLTLGCVELPEIVALSSIPDFTPDAQDGAVMEPIHLPSITHIGEFHDQVAHHSDLILCGAFSLNGQFMALGSADGVVHNYKVSKQTRTTPEGDNVIESKFTLLHRVQLFRSPVLSLSFSVDSSLVLVGAADGTTLVYSLDKVHVMRTDPVPQQPQKIEDVDLMRLKNMEQQYFEAPPNDVLWIDRKREEAAEVLRVQYRNKNAEIVNAVSELGVRLDALLEANDNAPELEKMDLEEFVVDLHGKETIVRSNHTTVANIHDEYQSQNMFNELVASRIRLQLWDTMDQHSVKLLPIMPSDAVAGSSDSVVSSFSVRLYTEKENTVLQRTKVLRSIEIRSQRNQYEGKFQFVNGKNARAVWNTSIQGVPTDVSWIAFDGTRWPVNDVVTMLLDKEAREAESAKQGKEGGDKEGGDKAAARTGSIAVEGGPDDDDEGDKGNGDHEFDDSNVLNLLYPPTAVRTHVQKRMQIIFMKEVARLIRIRFNEHFDKLLHEKEDVIGSIEQKNTRIEEVLAELRTTDSTIIKPKWQDEEVPGSAIVVCDEEVSSRPYENEKARAKRLKEEEERRKEMEKDKDDIKGRALMDMMYGTIEVKRDVLASADALQKPKWMEEIAVENFTETQRKEYDEFQDKLHSLQEEQAKYRKALEQEVKRLKAEIVDACKSFSEKMASLSRLKILTMKELFSVELYICRLSLSMAKSEQATRTIKRIEEDIEETRRQRSKLREKLDKFSAHGNQLAEKLNHLQEESATMERGFKRDIQTLCNATFDQDALKQLALLFRKRHFPEDSSGGGGDDYEEGDGEGDADDAAQDGEHGKSTRASKNAGSVRGGSKKQSKGGQSARQSKVATSKRSTRGASISGSTSQKQSGNKSGGMGQMQAALEALKGAEGENADKNEEQNLFNEADPFYFILAQKVRAKKQQEAQIPLADTLSMEIDCPETLNIDQYAWSKLNELRSSKIQKEIELKHLTVEHAEMKKKLDDMTAQDAALAAQIASYKATREETIRSLNRLTTDIDLVVALKQGQDEVDKDAVVTDYSDGVLLPTHIINRYNSRILELGKEKIAVLSKIKHFRRKINLVDWEATHMDMEAKHLEEYYTDLQLFRVTRELQQVIRGGIHNADKVKERLDRVQTRKEFLSKDSEIKLNKLRKLTEQYRLQNEERCEENAKLEGKIQDLRRQVEEREKVRQSRKESQGMMGDPAASAMIKMKKVVARRQLVDTARAQAEEIDFLRQELDRFRQKTFPSFLRATRTRLAPNPDEHYS